MDMDNSVVIAGRWGGISELKGNLKMCNKFVLIK